MFASGVFKKVLKAITAVAQDTLVERLCLEGFVCPSGQLWGMPGALPHPAEHGGKSGDHTSLGPPLTLENRHTDSRV